MPRSTIALIALACALGAAAPASAASRDTIIKDCSDDSTLQGHYTASELRDARKNLPSDISEYTDCADVLRRAELPNGGVGSGGGGAGKGSGVIAGGGGTSSGGSGTPSAPLTPASDGERQALAKAATSGSAPVVVNGSTVVPGAAGFSPNAPRSPLPDDLLFAIAAMVLLGIAGIATALRGRIGLGRMAPGRRP